MNESFCSLTHQGEGMKKLLVLLAVLTTATAMASGPNSTWDEIFANRRATVSAHYDSLNGIALSNVVVFI